MNVRRPGMHFAGMVLRGAGILCRRPLHIPARATVAGASAERKHRIELRIGAGGRDQPAGLAGGYETGGGGGRSHRNQTGAHHRQISVAPAPGRGWGYRKTQSIALTGTILTSSRTLWGDEDRANQSFFHGGEAGGDPHRVLSCVRV